MSKYNRLWVRFPLEKKKYLIFSFTRSGNEANRGNEFRHSTRNPSRIPRKVGNCRVLNGTESKHEVPRFPLLILFYAIYKVKLKKNGIVKTRALHGVKLI